MVVYGSSLLVSVDDSDVNIRKFWGDCFSKDCFLTVSQVVIGGGNLKSLLSQMSITICSLSTIHPGAMWEWCEWKKIPYKKSYWKAQEGKEHWEMRHCGIRDTDRPWMKSCDEFPDNLQKRDEMYGWRIEELLRWPQMEVEKLTVVLDEMSPYLVAANDKSKIENRRIHAIYGILLLERDLKNSYIGGIKARRATPSLPKK